MSKLVSLTVVLLLAMVSTGLANNFTDAGADHLYSNADNWQDGVPVYGASNQWANMNNSGTICIIDDTHVGANKAYPKGIYVGSGSGVNEWYITGGELQCDFLNVSRGRGAQAPFGYLEMSGGTVQVDSTMAIPEQFNMREGETPGETISGLMDMTGGTLYTAILKFGDGTGGMVAGEGYGGGFGTLNQSGGSLTADDLIMDVTWPAGSLNLSADAKFSLAGNQIDRLNGLITAGVITNTTGQAPFYDGAYTIIPEPATMILLGLGGLLIRRKR